MTRTALRAVLVAALIVLAGCSSSVTTGTTTPAAGTSGGTLGSTPAVDGSNAVDGSDQGPNPSGTTGTVAFYISDEPNAIGDFEHLNVTITKVGLHRTGTEANENGTDTEASENGTETETEAPTDTNETPSASPTATMAPTEDGGEGDDERESEDGESRDRDGEWVEYDVKRVVDLTELTGPNATKLDVLEAPAGTYDKVFIYVSEIDATLTNGDKTRVKLPSERLHINRAFTIGNGEEVQFVFDIAPHKAGKSGKYILKPVISQSGTGDETPIRDIDEREDTELDARFVGTVERGSEATVKVTGSGGPIEGASVAVGDEVVGETDADGTLSFTVPEDAEELEVTVTAGDSEAELEVAFDERRQSEDTEDDGNGNDKGKGDDVSEANGNDAGQDNDANDGNGNDTDPGDGVNDGNTPRNIG